MSDMRFSGETYDKERDQVRLAKQWWDVWRLMNDGRWHELNDISASSHWPEASVSARLRDFRKERFGQHIVQRRYVGDGLWSYRLIPNPDIDVVQKSLTQLELQPKDDDQP